MKQKCYYNRKGPISYITFKKKISRRRANCLGKMRIMSKMKSEKQNYSILFAYLSFKENDVHIIRKILLKEMKPG